MAKAMLLGAGGGGGAGNSKAPAQAQPAGPPLESCSASTHLPLSPKQTGSQWTLPAALGGKTGKAKGELGPGEDAVFPFRSSAS